MESTNDELIQQETEKILDNISKNLSGSSQLRGSPYARVYEAIYNLVKENQFYKSKELFIKNKFPYNSPLYHCAKATVKENGSTWSVNVTKKETHSDTYLAALRHFQSVIKNYTITTITIYKNESAMWLEETPLAVYTVPEFSQTKQIST